MDKSGAHASLSVASEHRVFGAGGWGGAAQRARGDRRRTGIADWSISRRFTHHHSFCNVNMLDKAARPQIGAGIGGGFWVTVAPFPASGQFACGTSLFGCAQKGCMLCRFQ